MIRWFINRLVITPEKSGTILLAEFDATVPVRKNVINMNLIMFLIVEDYEREYTYLYTTNQILMNIKGKIRVYLFPCQFNMFTNIFTNLHHISQCKANKKYKLTQQI